MDILKQTVGVDVSKDTLLVSLGTLDQNLNINYLFNQSFSNTLAGIDKLIAKVSQLQLTDKPGYWVMEATGVYHQRLAYRLHETGHKVCILLPNKAKSFCKSINQRAKTDKIDARLLCQLGLERKLDAWTPPDPLWQQVRALTREREQLVEQRTRLKNRRHALKRSTYQPRTTQSRLDEQISLINTQIRQLERELGQLIGSKKQIKQKVDNICRAKGIKLVTVATVLAETDGFSLIRNQRQLVAYSGLDVGIVESGGKVVRKGITKKGNAHIRKALYMPAMSASQSNQNFKDRYQKLSERLKINKQAVVAIARKLLILIYSLWKSGEEYDPERNCLTLDTV